uniref:Methyltransferase domaincontaining protein putative n=1 Tax=Albugo laibachii Nc14 TaxID=890382 RepID=F0WDH1_9STRA|nr:methyltransferase domaincontaining protein putative [Albugo laibachii Nc14]|eukprot:CCA19243.1 methyltransferase domaincontaining protein putative [Albugo laibachii Nc14]
MIGSRVPINRSIEALVETAGCCSNKLADDPNQIVCDDEWTEEREALAKAHLNKDTSIIPLFWQSTLKTHNPPNLINSTFLSDKYEMEASKNWDKFYKRNTTNFYKDRHYLDIVFPQLKAQSDQPQYLLEVGCGVGNAALPLLESNTNLHIIAVDFAPTAIELFKKQPLFEESRCTLALCDITKDDLRPLLPLNCLGVDYALVFFCLSGIHPSKMDAVALNIYNAIRPEGRVFLRDYGRYDQAQLRFKTGHKLEDNFYARGDNTRAYYFSTDEIERIFTQAGFQVVENKYIRRQYINRKQNIVRYRVWVHAVFQKPSIHALQSLEICP